MTISLLYVLFKITIDYYNLFFSCETFLAVVQTFNLSLILWILI